MDEKEQKIQEFVSSVGFSECLAAISNPGFMHLAEARQIITFIWEAGFAAGQEIGRSRYFVSADAETTVIDS